MLPMRAPTQLSQLFPFFVWLLLFYGLWLALVFMTGGLPVVLDHWPIAAAMAAGSYFAGSTPMGGGTIGFPVLVLIMDSPAVLGRDFSFAVQSIGMTSASIFILCRRQELEWPMLLAALGGSLLGTPLGIMFIAPLVSDLFIKLLFAAMWCSFGLLHLRRTREITSYEGMTPHNLGFDVRVGFVVGLIGGATVASITGVGIDLLIYMALVLWCHADLRIAIPTSVILMAFTSLLGIMTKLLLGGVAPGTYENWLAAAPVVALGAPLGVLVVSLVDRRWTLYLVSVLCLAQFIGTLMRERDSLTIWTLSLTLLATATFLVVFQAMYREGIRLARRSRQSGPGDGH